MVSSIPTAFMLITYAMVDLGRRVQCLAPRETDGKQTAGGLFLPAAESQCSGQAV